LDRQQLVGTLFYLNRAELSLGIIRQLFTSITNKTSDTLEKQQIKTKFTASRLLPSLAIILSLLTLQAMKHFWKTMVGCSTVSFTWFWALPLLPV
jgi:hypothetical protein